MRRKQLNGSDLIAVPRITSSAVLNLFLSLVLYSTAAAQEAATREPVAATDRFVFYSRFPFNLHDGLLRSAVGVEAGGSACLQALPDRHRDGWQWAVQQYHEVFTARGARRQALRVRFTLLNFGEQAEAELGPMPEEIPRALEAGTAAYRACWWRKEDEANRRWINALVAILLEVGEEVASRLGEAYQTPWNASSIPVDVVPYAGRTGASTVTPDHILITSTDERNQGRAALEMIFHEASHTIIGPQTGEPSRHFREVGERMGIEVPGDLWHGVLFYTTGEVVRKVIEEKYGEEYTPVLRAEGGPRVLKEKFLEPLETWWKPYLNGELEMSAAAEGLLRALSR